MVDLMILAAKSAKAHERRVRRNIILALSLEKKAPISMAYTGSLAPQFIKGTTKRVAILSLRSLNTLVAMTPGTAHPPEIPPLTTRAITELPCSPNQRNNLSSIYATRAI